MVFRGSRPPHSQVPLPGGEDKGRGERGASRTVLALSAALVLLCVLVVFVFVVR